MRKRSAYSRDRVGGLNAESELHAEKGQDAAPTVAETVEPTVEPVRAVVDENTGSAEKAGKKGSE